MSQTAFSLLVCIPDEAPARHDLVDARLTVGRSPENNIQVLVAEVSVKHGSIVPDGESYRFIDGDSTNGTKVNDATVGPEGVILSPSDKILLGTIVPIYFVSTAVLDITPAAELIASIEATPKAPVQLKTAPIAIATAVRAAPVLVSTAAAGAPTLRLDQAGSPAPGGVPVRPAPTPAGPRQPLPVQPAGPLKPGPVAPSTGAPRPVSVAKPAPLPSAPPASGPVAPRPVPLKPPAPNAPTIPLPKPPAKP